MILKNEIRVTKVLEPATVGITGIMIGDVIVINVNATAVGDLFNLRCEIRLYRSNKLVDDVRTRVPEFFDKIDYEEINKGE